MASGRSHGKTCVNKGARTYRTLFKHLELVLLTVGNQWKFLCGATSLGLVLGCDNNVPGNFEAGARQ